MVIYMYTPLLTIYPVRICAVGLCVWPGCFVYVYVDKIDLFIALPFGKTMLSVLLLACEI